MQAARSEWNAIFADTWHRDVARFSEGTGPADSHVRKLLKVQPSIEQVRSAQLGESCRLQAENARLLVAFWPRTGSDKRASVRSLVASADDNEVRFGGGIFPLCFQNFLLFLAAC